MTYASVVTRHEIITGLVAVHEDRVVVAVDDTHLVTIPADEVVLVEVEAAA